MYLIDEFSYRERSTSRRISSSVKVDLLFVMIIACILGMVVPTYQAQAQVGAADAFTAPTWQLGTSASRSSESARPSRRAANVTTTTRLEEFDLPQRTVRRASRTPRATTTTYTTRVVERKRTPRRVRVAALGNTTVVETRARPAVQKRVQRTRVAALGGGGGASVRAPSSSLTGGAIAWRASSGCLASNLRSIVASLSVNHGAVTVNSTCRSVRHNRRVGGARKSWHLTGNAVDFRIRGANIGRVYAYLRSTVGGLKHYGGGRFHIDNGPRRTF